MNIGHCGTPSSTQHHDKREQRTNYHEGKCKRIPLHHQVFDAMLLPVYHLPQGEH